MKKTVTLWLLLLTACICLVACTAKEPVTPEQPSSPTDVGCAHIWIDADCKAPKTCRECGSTEGGALGHTPAADDGDCATALLCESCGEELKVAGEHEPEADDGNCTTAQACTVCGQTAVEGKAHTDANSDYICDNPGCQITLPGAPTDNSPGIDLPVDRN